MTCAFLLCVQWITQTAEMDTTLIWHTSGTHGLTRSRYHHNQRRSCHKSWLTQYVCVVLLSTDILASLEDLFVCICVPLFASVRARTT